VLKLLYPERFATLEVKELALQIINGDITDLRALLVPKMQRKTLAETVDMPPLLEEEIEITLNPWFKKAYEVILQDDELSPMQKITILRQFLLNPAILELEPPGEHQMGKQVRLEQDIQTHFSEGRNKIIVVFNDFVKGLTQGENRLIQDIRYPTNCKVCIMDGNTPEGDRIAIQKQLNESDEPMVLFLSGKVGGVGINLSGAHVMIQYNEPWSKEEKAQQIGRCYRPGLKQPLLVQTYITSGTMEEGIHRHIDLKDKAIQKLLAGVKLTELEQRILSEDNEIAEDDLEVNPELASYYLNSFQDLLAMFGSIKNIGEEHFQEFLAKYGDRYAGNYSVLGDRSYQSNVARVNANILSQFVGSTNGHILDLASGPEMLRKRALSGQASNVISLDINQGHFVTKSTDGIWQKTEGTTTAVVGGISQIPVKTEAVVAVNLALGLHYTSFRPSQNDFERLRTICEINRVLQIGGKALITLQHGTGFKNETGFKELITLAGFTIDEKYTGEILGENFQARTYALVKTETADFETLKELIKEDKTEEKTLADSLKLNFAGHKKTFRDTRGILTAITLGKQTITLELNETDKTALAEEQAIHSLAESLQSIHGEIKEIPRDILIRHKFARIKLGGHYVLFKELEKSKGVILIKSH
jgi:ubiquinone/menaquinone biosynthesis C-methylase UbiE